MKPYTLLFVLIWCQTLVGAPATSVVDNLSFNGQVDSDQASFILKGRLKGGSPEEQEAKLIYSAQSQARLQVDPQGISQTVDLKVRVFQGKLKELQLAMRGDGEVTNVTGVNLKDWSVRYLAPDNRFLVLRPYDLGSNAPALTNFNVTIYSKHSYRRLPIKTAPLTFTPENTAFFDSVIDLKPHESLELSTTNFSGLLPIRSTLDPANTDKSMQFRVAGQDYGLTIDVREKDPDSRRVIWDNFKLSGELKDQFASFVLTGQAIVKHPEGGTLEVLAGDAALTSFPSDAEMRFAGGRYFLRFRKPGTYPVELKFDAKVSSYGGWNGLNFEVVPSALCPLVLKGLGADTQFQFPGAAKPERQGNDFASYLPSSGKLQLQWKEAKTEEIGKLFYSVQGTAVVSVGPGLLRQAYAMEYKVMQGELNQLVFDLTGEGEVIRVRGDDILSWNTTTTDNKRQLVVQLSQARKDRYAVLIQTQTPLKAFPLQVQPLRLVPTQAIRYGGHVLVVNDGAVRLEVTESRGLSQISPDLYPLSKDLVEFVPVQRSQAFAYRFSGGDFALGIQAEHILPELTVSQVLVYNLGETETSIDAELELEIREAPLREFYVRIPADYTVSRCNTSDFTTIPGEAGWARLKMIFANPISGRQVIQMRLEKNQNAAAGAWNLPVIQPQNVKSLRGYVGVAAETGFRISVKALSNLTEVANAYFPKRVSGLQAAYRVREDSWQARMNVERLALSIQADATHLFTVSEGIAYGSSVINYFISGTPVSVLKVTVPPEYSNIEFAGRDVRSWKKNTNTYEIYLQTPVFGAYTLLATYDRQFSAQSNTVSFVGAQPVDAQSERGSVLVVSDYQFEVKPAQRSEGLLQLDPGEIPPEHRLLFDSPLLAAYQYTTRPFRLALTLQSLDLGQTVHQVVDRAVLKTHVSREGEVVTLAKYYLKNQGDAHLRFTLSTNAELWEATVNGSKVVPVSERNQTLIALPTKLDPSALLEVELKIASKSPDKARVKFAAPVIDAPVMLTEWNVEPDKNYQLKAITEDSTVGPSPRGDNSGYAWLWRVMKISYPRDGHDLLIAIPILLVVGMLLMRWGTREGVYRWSPPNVIGVGFGALSCIAAIVCLIALIVAAMNTPMQQKPGFDLVAPIQNPGSILAMQVESAEISKLGFSLLTAWPALIGLALWIYLPTRTQPGPLRHGGIMVGWLFMCWAALKISNGAPAFFGVVLAFVILHLIIPSVRYQWHMPRRIKPPVETAAATTALLMLGLLSFGLSSGQAAPAPVGRPPIGVSTAAVTEELPKNIVQSMTQEARVQDKFVYVTAKLQWKADAGQRLEFLSAPAVLNKIEYPQSSLELSAAPQTTGMQVGASGYKLTAKETGVFDITFQYQLSLSSSDTSFVLPTAYGMVNRVQLEIEKAEVDVFSDRAVSVQATHEKRQGVDITRAAIVLSPMPKPVISWKPRSRDVKAEKAVFYAELWHLYIPTPGVIEGVHDVQVRPAQGQLAEVTFQVPAGLTITDVQADFISAWRFDPDQHALRVQFNAPQSRPFALRVRSQLATTPLPYQQTLGVISINQAGSSEAASQVGMLGLATGSEVQLEQVKESLSAINLEDFPAAMLTSNAIPGLALRRAFRYSDPKSELNFSASAVQPNVWVESDETLSIGEDRTLLASKLSVQITRAGLFKLSFVLPRDFEVESLTGTALSHWASLKSGDDRIITMNLRGKTEGNQMFNITLTGPGMGNRKEGEAPRLVLREASKHTGQLVIVPESGMRLHVKNREGLSDPPKINIRQKGVMAYLILHNKWQFAFDIETVEPWIQVNSLQDVTVREGQVLVGAEFDYQIENAGLRSLMLQLPAKAENVRIEGDYISDSIRGEAGTNRLADWQVKLQRRVMGNYSLRATYQLPLTNQSAVLGISGIKAKDANMQRGYLAVRAVGRLQIEYPQIPAALQRTEWQSIPANLRRNRDLAQSKDTFSTLEADYELPFLVTRHELAQILPARVERLDLTSVVSASGEMLTEGRLIIYPGDKRLLRLELPESTNFWYAFMNGQSATPWRQEKSILLMLEKNSDPTKPTTVEFFYTSPTVVKGSSSTRQFIGPKFDLPLEKITWNVYVPENWKVGDWESSLQLHPEVVTGMPVSYTLEKYMADEKTRQYINNKEAESLLQRGNEYVQKGAPQQARQAFREAYNRSPQDAAFNEDARVQLHNLKMQQALIGINERRNDFAVLGNAGVVTNARVFQNVQPNQAPEYTQQQAKEVLEQNLAEDNAALTKLADRLVRQQDAAVARPQSIRATLPTTGKLLMFTGSLQVKSDADLRVKLDAKATSPGTKAAHFLALCGLLVLLGALGLLARNPAKAHYAAAHES